MAISFPATITGSAQTGFTAPTYSTSVDSAPDIFSKQVAVTALGGTQAGVVPHSISKPFTLTWKRMQYLKALLNKYLNGISGKYSVVPRNVHSLLIRKGVDIQANQSDIASMRISLDIPAGSETYDIANVRAMLSAGIGALTALSAGIGDTVNNGVN